MNLHARPSALDEAQRLLAEHGTWTTDSGAYLESDTVTVLINPVHDDVAEVAAGPVDVVVTVRPRPGRLPLGGVIEIEGTEHPVISLPLNGRGQAVFRQLPPGEWTARLVATSGQSAGPPHAATVATMAPLHRVSRRLAAAAGSERREIHHTYTSGDGRLVTEVVETDEAHLVVTVSSSEPPSAAAVVRLSWAPVDSETTGQLRTLVFPLARRQEGAVVTAKYDLGSVDQLEAVDMGSAEWADPSALTEALILQAFDLGLYGSARRGWEELAAAGVCSPSVQSALLAALEG